MRGEQIDSGLHEDFRRELTVQGSSDRVFGVVFAVLFAGIGLWPFTTQQSPRIWALAVGLGLLLVALVRPGLLGPANRLWTGLGTLLGRFVNPVVTGIMFFLVITPVALLKRWLSRNDPLHLRSDPEAATYWLPRQPPGPPAQSMQRQF